MTKLMYLIPIFGIFALSGCSQAEKDVVTKNIINEVEPERVVMSELVDGVYAIDIEKSVIGWEGNMVAKSHTGTMSVKRGFFEVENGKINNGEIIADMTTIKSDENLESLVTHLAGPDFFDVEKFPESKMIINSLANSGDNPLLKADLFIKDKKNPIEISAIVKNSNERELEFSSDFEIDRSLWDVRYGSDKFFDNLGDKVINDEIVYNINIVASLQN